MNENNLSQKETDAARLFFEHALGLKDMTSLIIKGHLVLEEITRRIINEKLPNPEALKEARLECFQAICLAQSLCDKEHFNNIWRILKKLNKLRNDISHNLENKGLTDRVDDINKSWDSGLGGDSRQENLFMTIFSLVSILTSFLQNQDDNVIQLFN